MSNNIEKMANDFFRSSRGEKLASKQGELKNLINSTDGQKIKSVVESDAASLKTAIDQGDTQTLQNTLNSILNTEEGARLVKQLKNILK